MPSDKDIVEEARELLACNLPIDAVEIQHALFADAIERQTNSPFWSRSKVIALGYARAPELLRALADEVERLRRGDFTPEEFQNLCHNTDIQAGFDAFADGCEAFQQKMFGRCRKGQVHEDTSRDSR